MVTPFSKDTLQDGQGAGDIVAAPESVSDAPPSNRASNTCSTPFFEVYSRHVDSLEVSVPGRLSLTADQHFRSLKEKAQSRQEMTRAHAQVVLAGECLEVRDKGVGRFPFVLVSEHFFLKFSSCEATSLPLAACQIRNRFLLQVGVEGAVARLVELLAEFGEVHGDPVVSRADLAVDFSTDIAVKAWPIESWVTKLARRDAFSDRERFTGWSIGNKASFQFGLYDKTYEIETKSRKTYLHDLWKDNGWFVGDTVWRAEARFRRLILGQLGVSSVSDLGKSLASLWAYAAGDLVRLVTPSESDATRARWPLHPLWGQLVAVDWGLPQRALTRQYKGIGAP